MKNSVMTNIPLIIFLTIHVVHGMDNGCSGQQGEFKYLVSVRRFGEILCSGTIIHESYILTVGRVVRNVHSSELGIIADIVMETYPRFTYFSVEHVYFHSESRRINIPDVDEYWKNDFALLKLKQKLSWTPNIGPIQLTNNDLPESSSALFTCQIVSWNNSIEYYENAMAPIWNFADIFWERNCYPWNMLLLINEKCFIDPLRTGIISWAFLPFIDELIKEISQHDLGSPIICDNMMVGLTVRTNSPATAESPSILLSLFPHRDFITGVINDGSIDVNEGEFSYVVSIWLDNNLHCSGTILDATHILSAGHCFERARLRDYEVTFGSTTIWRFGPLVPWLSINDFEKAPHYRSLSEPGWAGMRKRHDMAVIRLGGNVTWGPTVGHIDLPELVSFPSGQICVLLHWEQAANEFGVVSMKLKKFPVTLVANQACQLLGVHLRYNEFCVKTLNPSSIIEPGDSGNPIMCGGKPFGIVVQGYAPPLPTICLELFPYEEFITASMSRI